MESNSRIVQWSDGSYQLIVGDGVFPVKINPDENCFAYIQQNSVSNNTDYEDDSTDKGTGLYSCFHSYSLTHLFTQVVFI